MVPAAHLITVHGVTIKSTEVHKMKRTFLKVLPFAAALLLATSCSKEDNTASDEIVNNGEQTETVAKTVKTLTINGKVKQGISKVTTNQAGTGLAFDGEEVFTFGSETDDVYGAIEFLNENGDYKATIYYTDEALLFNTTFTATLGANPSKISDPYDDLATAVQHACYETEFSILYGNEKYSLASEGSSDIVINLKSAFIEALSAESTKIGGENIDVAAGKFYVVSEGKTMGDTDNKTLAGSIYSLGTEVFGFSVSETQKVVFSSGNLQYQASGGEQVEQSFTITFKSSASTKNDGSSPYDNSPAISDLVANGAGYLQSISCTKVYLARQGWGIKLGSGTIAGSIELNLKEWVNATRIVVNAKRFNANESEQLTINGSNITLTDDFSDITKTYTTATGISSITLTPTTLRRAYVTSVTVYYNVPAGTWRFAPNQYTVIGNAAGNTTAANRRGISSDWIDLFGWGAWTENGTNPWSVSTTNSDYKTGVENSGDFSSTSSIGSEWFTLSQAQWTYLLGDRDNASSLWGLGKIGDIKGLILLPDGGKLPSGLTFVPGENENSYSTDEWAQMEAKGAVFLPWAGYRQGTSVSGVNESGNYWTSSAADADNAYNISFSSDIPNTGSVERNEGRSVRLVKSL